MKILIAADHGGFELKEKLKPYLLKLGYKVKDLGTDSPESVDYPDYAVKLSKQLAGTKDKGILICGTGIGMCMTANKIKGIRAAFAYDKFTAKMSRAHNNANVLCLGGRVTSFRDAKTIVKIFLETDFDGDITLGIRHKRRISKIDRLLK